MIGMMDKLEVVEGRNKAIVSNSEPCDLDTSP